MHIHMKNQNIKYSQHYLKDRMHRFNDEYVIEGTLRWGEFIYDKRNGKVYFLSEKSFRNMKKAGISKQEIEFFRKKRAVRIVVSLDGVLITGMYANNSKKHLH